MHPFSLTPMEDWLFFKAKPDNMVLAATSWPGKTLCYWKTCFSFALLLQALTQGRKGWSYFGELNQALSRQISKMGKVGKSKEETMPCVTPGNCMTFSGFSVLLWLQALWILLCSPVHARWFRVPYLPQQLTVCLSNPCYASGHLIRVTISILHEGSVTLHLAN